MVDEKLGTIPDDVLTGLEAIPQGKWIDLLRRRRLGQDRPEGDRQQNRDAAADNSVQPESPT
ncbi:MAG TPA: hypothetical protein VGM20_05475 [Gemmatimonadales bacterium]|jgi:hypothetical protein